MSAFGVFTFIEASVLLVAAAVLFLVWARSEKKGFHLPGGDGTAIALAGGWAVLLLVWRLFDKPDAPDETSSYGIQWGMFAALAAAGALLAAGLRVRAAHRPEPPNPAAEDVEPPPPRPPRRRADPAAVTEVLGERPDWSGEPPEAPGRAPRRRRGSHAASSATATRRRPAASKAASRRPAGSKAASRGPPGRRRGAGPGGATTSGCSSRPPREPGGPRRAPRRPRRARSRSRPAAPRPLGR